MKITFSHRFEAAHRFLESSSKCSTPHGHTWWTHLTLEHDSSLLQENKNYLEDFGPLKAKWKRFIDEELDHHFFLNSEDPLKDSVLSLHPEARLKLTPGDPTTEALASIFFNKAHEIFMDFKGIKPFSLKLQETPTNAIEVNEVIDRFCFVRV